MRTGIGFLGGPGLRELAEAAVTAEAHGFESAWFSETRITRDAVSAMTAMLLATRTIAVGSSAINVVTRSVAVVASTWAALVEAAPGRVILGVGAGSPSTLEQEGLVLDHPARRLQEFVEAVRLAWTAAPPIDYAGRHFQLAGLSPEVTPAPAPPVYICAGGVRTLALAGRVADGVIADVFLPPSAIDGVIRRVRAGNPTYEGDLAAAIITSVADTEAEAAARLRPRFAQYLIKFPELAEHLPLDPEWLARIRATAARDGIEAIHPEIPDDLIARCSACGPRSACEDAVARYRDAGVTLPILFAEPDSLGAVLAGLGPDTSS
jgi:alkanesulfonate monooxygenase SsuD/methylene tetrahydromethanopterin reductase-like flavin-dependent oxidoreductase (luciferase family)